MRGTLGSPLPPFSNFSLRLHAVWTCVRTCACVGAVEDLVRGSHRGASACSDTDGRGIRRRRRTVPGVESRLPSLAEGFMNMRTRGCPRFDAGHDRGFAVRTRMLVHGWNAVVAVVVLVVVVLLWKLTRGVHGLSLSPSPKVVARRGGADIARSGRGRARRSAWPRLRASIVVSILLNRLSTVGQVVLASWTGKGAERGGGCNYFSRSSFPSTPICTHRVTEETSAASKERGVRLYTYTCMVHTELAQQLSLYCKTTDPARFSRVACSMFSW